MVKIPPEWLIERVEDAPTSYGLDRPPRVALGIRMAWQKVKRQARPGDEIWAFESPSNTWKKQGRRTGYALVRDGEVVDGVIVTNE
jgi:hypothetical protein